MKEAVTKVNRDFILQIQVSTEVDRVVSEYTIDTADLVPRVYQTCGKWLRCIEIEFSDTTGVMKSVDQYSQIRVDTLLQ